jgi:hypothetical protein
MSHSQPFGQSRLDRHATPPTGSLKGLFSLSLLLFN